MFRLIRVSHLLFLQVVRSVYTSKIISSYRDLVALVFYGTKESKNPRNSFKHVYVYHDLDEPGEMLNPHTPIHL